MDASTRRKWDFSSGFYDLLAYGPERRWAPEKRALFANMRGKVLFVAIGTGQDIHSSHRGRILSVSTSVRACWGRRKHGLRPMMAHWICR